MSLSFNGMGVHSHEKKRNGSTCYTVMDQVYPSEFARSIVSCMAFLVQLEDAALPRDIIALGGGVIVIKKKLHDGIWALEYLGTWESGWSTLERGLGVKKSSCGTTESVYTISVS